MKKHFDHDLHEYQEISSTNLTEIDLLDRKQRIKAIQAILDGKVVAGHMRRVFGLWIDAAHVQARQTVADIKGEVVDKKMSIMTTGNFLVPHIDIDRIKPELRKFVEDAALYSSTFGALCHTIVPIRPRSLYLFPKTVISTSGDDHDRHHLVYNLDPTGHPGMEEFIRDLEYEKIIPAVTSMNPARRPEVTKYDEAIFFLHSLNPELKPNVMMRDANPVREDILGSFTQIDLVLGTVVRDGHVPAHILGWMLGIEVDPKKFKKHNYPHGQFENIFEEALVKLNPYEIRDKLLRHMHQQ